MKQQDTISNIPLDNEGAHSNNASFLVDNLTVSRGLVLSHNHRNKHFRDADLHRWLTYSVRILDCAKLDLLANGLLPQSLLSTVLYAREFSVPVSLRTDGSGTPEGLKHLAREGLDDVLLCPEHSPESILPWLNACRDLGLPIRLLINPGTIASGHLSDLAHNWKQAGVCSVILVRDDPFHTLISKKTQCDDTCQTAVNTCNLLVDALWDLQIECKIRGFNERDLNERGKVCLIRHASEEIYSPGAVQMALSLFPRSRAVIRTALLTALKMRTVAPDITDKWLTRILFVYVKPLFYIQALFPRLFRSVKGTRHAQIEFQQADATLQQRHEDLARHLSESAPDTFIHGHVVLDSHQRPRYLDRVDRERLQQLAMKESLAREARDWQSRTEPSKIISENWGASDAFVIPQYGATAWMTNLSGHRVSHSLGVWERPFIVSTTVGSGMAEAVGFTLAGNTTLMCPMVESRHTVSLYVTREGYYVLMRDGIPVEPILYPGEYAAPGRLSSSHPVSFLMVSALDIEKRIAFSPLKFWEGACLDSTENKSSPKYSVVIFCTRFARRVSAALQCLLHQKDFDLSKLEVLVAFIPGLDATEDVLESMKQAHPELTIYPQSFSKQHVRSKGYVLNQCMERARGEWVMLLDADTLVPPFLFSTLEKEEQEQSFIFPSGRALIGPQDTAAILLGDIRPWKDWDTLLARADNLLLNESLGVPIGYCQCFRKSIFDKIRYPEYEHFQGADFEFGQALRKLCGQEYRLDFPVLHLDHQGSQWFGAERHF